MMRILSGVITCALSMSLMANDCVECDKNPLPEISPLKKTLKTSEAILKFVIDETNVQEFLSNASAFLNQIKDKTTFDEMLAESYTKKLKEIALNPEFENRTRAKSYLFCSGIIGKLGEKRSSPALGKESYHMVKTAMKTDQTYKDAKVSFITAVTRLSERNLIARKFIEGALDISIVAEAKEAISIIEKEKWQEDPKVKPLYKQLKDFIN